MGVVSILGTRPDIIACVLLMRMIFCSDIDARHDLINNSACLWLEDVFQVPTYCNSASRITDESLAATLMEALASQEEYKSLTTTADHPETCQCTAIIHKLGLRLQTTPLHFFNPQN